MEAVAVGVEVVDNRIVSFLMWENGERYIAFGGCGETRGVNFLHS